MWRNTGRRTTLLLIVTTITLLAIAVAGGWETIRTHYCCWRLDGTSTAAEAQVYWDHLVRNIDQPRIT
jgi:hypothetical protein